TGWQIADHIDFGWSDHAWLNRLSVAGTGARFPPCRHPLGHLQPGLRVLFLADGQAAVRQWSIGPEADAASAIRSARSERAAPRRADRTRAHHPADDGKTARRPFSTTRRSRRGPDAIRREWWSGEW